LAYLYKRYSMNEMAWFLLMSISLRPVRNKTILVE
jgi:hypothetical protein